MASNKNHHFVPKFYLRRFGHGGCVAVYNLEQRKHIARASISGQCQRAYLYGRDPTIEKQLSRLEGDAARVIDNMVTGEQAPSNFSIEEVALLSFVAFQWGRTPAAGRVSEVMLSKMTRAMLRAPGVTPEALHSHINETRVEHENPVIFSLAITASLAPLLSDLHRCLLVNDSAIEFITSDSPVIFHNFWAEGVTWQGTTGFASAGLQVLLPLGPRHVLLLYDEHVYAVGCRKAPAVVHVAEPRDVERINAMQVATAVTNVYYSGSPETARSIESLPVDWRQSPEESVRVNRALDASETSQLVHLYRGSKATMPLSFLRILRKARAIPVRERGRKLRSAAIELDKRINGDRREHVAPDSDLVRRVWTTVDD